VRSDEISQQLLNHQRLIAPFPAEYAYSPGWAHALSLPRLSLVAIIDIPALSVPPDHGFALGRNNLTLPTPGLLCRAAEIRVQAGETGNGK